MSQNNSIPGEEQQTSTYKYLRTFRESLSSNGLEGAIENPEAETRAFLYDTKQRTFRLSDVSSLAHRKITIQSESEQDKGDDTILVVENINLDWIVALGTTLNIEATFFCQHGQNPVGWSPWQSVFGGCDSMTGQKRPTQYSADEASSTTFHHIDGVVRFGKKGPKEDGPHLHTIENPNFFHRRLKFDVEYGWQANTRISYCQIRKNLYVYLVDAPMKMPPGPAELSTNMSKLYIPVSNSRGGLVLPQIFGNSQFSLSLILAQFFSHAWHIDLLSNNVLSTETFLYILASSTWSFNFHHLNRKIKRIAFTDIRRPSILINDTLHSCRETLDTLREKISYTRKYIPRLVLAELQTLHTHNNNLHLPPDTLSELLLEAQLTERFLMDTFQLLMSSISVLDSETSIRQAARGQKLTQLAFVYVPLSFVTSVFGMNVREINDSPLRAWVCVVFLFITVFMTAVLFGEIQVVEKWKRNRKLKRREV